MSARDAAPVLPDLPEDFGNPWMSNLQEIGLPEPIPWTPAAPGWYLLGALLLAAALRIGLRLLRRHRDRAYRREALAALAGLRPDPPGASVGPANLSELPRLLKRTALSAYPRSEVAGLSGDAWLSFLDRAYGGRGFTSGPGRLLPDLSYAAGAGSIEPERVEALFTLAETWIRKHRTTTDTR